MASRLNLARLGAAVLGASVALVLSAALPANAAGTTPQDVIATVGGGDIAGTPLTMDYTDTKGVNGPHAVTPVLIALTLPGEPKTIVHTYCVELNVDLNPHVNMKESGWDSYPDPDSPFNKNNEQINWILHNSYPQASLDAVSEAAGVSTALTQQEAIAATQAAIWHFSDNAALDPGTKDAGIKALYNYLTGSSNKGLAQPSGNSTPVANPTLTISPNKQLVGTAGSKVGPFTISTNMTGLELAAQLPSGVTLVDGKGAAVNPSTLTNGSQVYFNVPAGAASGVASFTLNTPATVGELFVGTTEGQNQTSNDTLQRHGVHSNCSPQISTQTLIVAQTSVSASASAQWVANVVVTTTTKTTTSTTAPSTETTTETTSAPVVAAPTTTSTGGGTSLPFTGVSLIAPIALAVVLIGGGATFLLLQRRKRAAEH